MTWFERFWREYDDLILFVWLPLALCVALVVFVYFATKGQDDEGVCLNRGGVYAVTKRHYVSTGKSGYMHRHYECFVPASEATKD